MTGSPATSILLHTPRQIVRAIEPAMARVAAAGDHSRLAELLGADVPSAWPAKDLADVQQFLSDGLNATPHDLGWWGWYMLARPGVVADRSTLIGSCGCGRFGTGGKPIFGYGILPAYEGRGLTTEAARVVADWVIAQPGVSVIEATTFERHFASIKILERCGFACVGVSDGDATASEDDRQGRGRLMLFVRRA
ncbi:MAG: GNAT family N-acetyltransferase [Phycisphaerales bacterium]